MTYKKLTDEDREEISTKLHLIQIELEEIRLSIIQYTPEALKQAKEVFETKDIGPPPF